MTCPHGDSDTTVQQYEQYNYSSTTVTNSMALPGTTETMFVKKAVNQSDIELILVYFFYK